LIIFDGKTITNEEMSAINPEDIKEINVFKDNAATASYGEKGKNGVIIITSKNKHLIIRGSSIRNFL